jgi:hypothetical protein
MYGTTKIGLKSFADAPLALLRSDGLALASACITGAALSLR